jgi:hypothetical protein
MVFRTQVFPWAIFSLEQPVSSGRSKAVSDSKQLHLMLIFVT